MAIHVPKGGTSKPARKTKAHSRLLDEQMPDIATHLLPQLFFLGIATSTSTAASLPLLLLPMIIVVVGDQIDCIGRRASSTSGTCPTRNRTVRTAGSSRRRRAPTPAAAAAHDDGPVGQTHGRRVGRVLLILLMTIVLPCRSTAATAAG